MFHRHGDSSDNCEDATGLEKVELPQAEMVVSPAHSPEIHVQQTSIDKNEQNPHCNDDTDSQIKEESTQGMTPGPISAVEPFEQRMARLKAEFKAERAKQKDKGHIPCINMFRIRQTEFSKDAISAVSVCDGAGISNEPLAGAPSPSDNTETNVESKLVGKPLK